MAKRPDNIIEKAKDEHKERLKQLMPEEKDWKDFCEISDVHPVNSLRCNTLKISVEDLKKRLEKKWKIKQPYKENPEIFVIEGKTTKSSEEDNEEKSNNNNVIATTSERGGEQFRLAKGQYNKNGIGSREDDLEPGELGKAKEHLLGYYYIQEIASMMPIIALNPDKNDILIDLCAAPGSKTTQAAAKMENQGTIIANDASSGRIGILSTNIQRCGVTNTIITKLPGEALCKRLQKIKFKVNKILVDAPCSGEGTIRSSVMSVKMFSKNLIYKLSKTQKRLVDAAVNLLEVNGEMIYSTCTHAPEENEAVVSYILSNYPNMKIEDVIIPLRTRKGITQWNGVTYHKDVIKCARIYPQDNDTEGFFISKFRKVK
jgi:NOL1/NOP2/sun family putative RNA methylase